MQITGNNREWLVETGSQVTAHTTIPSQEFENGSVEPFRRAGCHLARLTPAWPRTTRFRVADACRRIGAAGELGAASIIPWNRNVGGRGTVRRERALTLRNT